jgi:hypothetical protein
MAIAFYNSKAAKPCSDSPLCYIGAKQDFTFPIFVIHKSLCGNCQKVGRQIIHFLMDLLTQGSKRCLNNYFTFVNSTPDCCQVSTRFLSRSRFEQVRILVFESRWFYWHLFMFCSGFSCTISWLITWQTKIVEQKSQPREAFKCKLVCWMVVNITIYIKQY